MDDKKGDRKSVTFPENLGPDITGEKTQGLSKLDSFSFRDGKTLSWYVFITIILEIIYPIH